VRDIKGLRESSNLARSLQFYINKLTIYGRLVTRSVLLRWAQASSSYDVSYNIELDIALLKTHAGGANFRPIVGRILPAD
jgi:hypothetical protein